MRIMGVSTNTIRSKKETIGDTCVNQHTRNRVFGYRCISMEKKKEYDRVFFLFWSVFFGFSSFGPLRQDIIKLIY